MADENRIVFPDEVECIKAKAVKEAQTVQSNSKEEPPLEENVQYKCMIEVPPNYILEKSRGADGELRVRF